MTTTEAHREGLRAAGDRLSREAVNERARAMPVREGDAFLAGYYQELRRLRAREAIRNPAIHY